MRVTGLFLTFVFSAVSFGQTTVPVESLNRTIQNRLNQPTRYTDKFEIKPVRAMSAEAEQHYQVAIDAQRPVAILRAASLLKQNASYKRSDSPSERKTYMGWVAELKYYQSPEFKPALTVLQKGEIGHPEVVKVLQALPDGLIRATVGADRHEVFIKGIHTTSDSDEAWLVPEQANS